MNCYHLIAHISSSVVKIIQSTLIIIFSFLRYPIVKRVILYLLLFSSSGIVRSQSDSLMNLPKYDLKTYHFGFVFGVNKMYFNVRTFFNPNIVNSTTVNPDFSGLGFNIGVVANMRLNKFLDLRFLPELAFGSRSLVFNYQSKVQKYDYKTTQLNFPLLLKIKYKRIMNSRLYLTLGSKYQLALTDKQNPASASPIIKMRNNDFCFQLGTGFDKYLKYFKFSPEVDFSFGLRDLILHDNTIFSNSIQNISSRSVEVYFYFE
jgi:hypothetical protein